MKFDTLRLVGATAVNLPVVSTTASGPFVLKGVDGLDAPDISVAYADKVDEGGIRQNRRAVNREVVVLIGLQPDWASGYTPESLRTTLYGLLSPAYDQQISVQIVKDNVVLAQAKGDVSKLEASIFSKDPEVQVSIDCDSPYLEAPQAIAGLPTNVAVADGYTTFDIENVGTAPAGMLIAFTLNDGHSGTLQIMDQYPFGPRMDLGTDWQAGESVVIDTRSDTRGLYHVEPGDSVMTPAMSKLSPGSPWMKLHPGVNHLRINDTAVNWYLYGSFYTPRYWGV